MRIATNQRLFGFPVEYDTELSQHVIGLVNPRTGQAIVITGEDTMTDKHDEFALAMKAFDFFTLDERRQMFEELRDLQYPDVADRAIEAVHRVIQRAALAGPARTP